MKPSRRQLLGPVALLLAAPGAALPLRALAQATRPAGSASAASTSGRASPPGAALPPSVVIVGSTFARLYEPGVSGRPEGLAVDLLDAILQPAGVMPRYALVPWLRAQAMIEQGAADILVGPYRTPEREARMRFSRQPFYEDALVFYARRGEQALWWGDFTAVRQARIATVQGWAYGARFDQARSLLQLTAVRDLPTALRMLQLGRLDLVAANQRNAEPVIASLGLATQVLPCPPPFGQLRGHFGFRLAPEAESLQTLVDLGLQRLRSAGTLLQLAARRGVLIPD